LPDGENDMDILENGEFAVVVEGMAVNADVSLKPFYQPANKNKL
jgi:hypothetical protein